MKNVFLRIWFVICVIIITCISPFILAFYVLKDIFLFSLQLVLLFSELWRQYKHTHNL